MWCTHACFCIGYHILFEGLVSWFILYFGCYSEQNGMLEAYSQHDLVHILVVGIFYVGAAYHAVEALLEGDPMRFMRDIYIAHICGKIADRYWAVWRHFVERR